MRNEIYAKIKTRIGVFIMDYTFLLVQLSKKNIFGRWLCLCHRFFLSLLNISFYPVESAVCYKDINPSCDIIPIKTGRMGYVTTPAFEVEKTNSKLEKRLLPDLNLYHFQNVIIQGDSDIVVDKLNGCVINDYCYDLDSSVKFVDGLLYQLKSNICLIRSNFKHINKILQSGIMISGKFSRNYYHEILENLIKLVILDTLDIPNDVPIIVDSSVSDIPAFEFIFSKLSHNQNREVVFLHPKDLCLVKELYTISNVNIITPHLIGRSISKEDIIFDIEIVIQLKEKLLQWRSDDEYPKKIFLTRKNTNHRNFNEKEVIDLIKPMGFVEIAPEELSFQQQMSIFNQANVIVGGTGAAFTNLMFANQECKAMCVRPNVEGAPSVFSILAQMNGASFLYYRSNETRQSDNIHSDYYVEPQKFADSLKKYLDYEG